MLLQPTCKALLTGTCRLIGRFYFWSRVLMTMFTKGESVALERAGRLDQVCMCQGNPFSIRCRLAKGEPVLKSRKTLYEGNLFATSPRPDLNVHLTMQYQN